MDKRGIPTKATIMEVDEETGKVILEYIHGGLEAVEPNIIKEALLSREQEDDNNGLWTFSMILATGQLHRARLGWKCHGTMGRRPGSH
eukprot:8939338-Ditylum_brightwellii.AAC.1